MQQSDYERDVYLSAVKNTVQSVYSMRRGSLVLLILITWAMREPERWNKHLRSHARYVL